MKKSDEKILNLKKKIDEKRKALKDIKFTPITNCILSLNGNRYNLHVNLPIEEISMLISLLNSMKMGLKEILPEETLMISGYSVDDWLTDLKAKYYLTNQVKEKLRLKDLEEELTNLLSNSKKVELRIDSLEKEI